MLRGGKLYYRSSSDAEFRVGFSVSSWEEYLDTEVVFPGKDSAVCAGCCLAGGQVRGPFPTSSLFKRDGSHVFHRTGCTHRDFSPAGLFWGFPSSSAAFGSIYYHFLSCGDESQRGSGPAP